MSRPPSRAALVMWALLFNTALALPRALGAGETLLVLTLELCVLALLGPLVGGRALPRRLVVGLVFGWLVLLGYHCAMEAIYLRPPSLYDDWRLARNLVHYLASTGAGVKTALFVLAPAWLALGSGAANALLARSAALTGRDRTSWLLVWGLGLGLCGVSLEFPGVQQVARSTSTATHLRRNADQSLRQWRLMRAWQEGPADRTYEALMARRLEHRPNVYFLMIEAYGEVLERAPFQDFTTRLAEQVETRLAMRGYHTRSTLSRAPVHGGASWLSIATMHTGMRIDAASSYASFEAVSRTIPSLTRFFEGNGYQTISLMPGNTLRSETGDQFARQVVLEGPDLGFQGHPQVWGAAPDQYSLGFLRERVLAGAQGPLFVSFMSCSTHWSWWYVPPFVEDWELLGTPDETDERPRYDWAPLPNTIEHRHSHDYAVAVEYEWRALLEFIEAEPTDDAVFIIVGDHQPWLGPGLPRDSWLTPVHVVTRHVPTLEAFDAASFEPHLFPPLKDPVLTHEGLLSLIISRLAVADGKREAAAGYRPLGVSLSGLKAGAP